MADVNKDKKDKKMKKSQSASNKFNKDRLLDTAETEN